MLAAKSNDWLGRRTCEFDFNWWRMGWANWREEADDVLTCKEYSVLGSTMEADKGKTSVIKPTLEHPPGRRVKLKQTQKFPQSDVYDALRTEHSMFSLSFPQQIVVVVVQTGCILSKMFRIMHKLNPVLRCTHQGRRRTPYSIQQYSLHECRAKVKVVMEP